MTETKNKNKSLINDLVRISVLEEEIEYYKTLLQPHDTGHIHTSISFLSQRLSNLKGELNQWPFA
tara:strand:+ start:15144 stop:15338 length:195 start_codon:yes stop_codon:yes gene_type:complete